MDLLITFLIFVIVLIALWYVVGMIPDATLQKIARAIIVVGALIWLIRHVRPLINSLTA